MKHEYGFERLNVWQNSRLLVKEIYQKTASFPKDELYGLTNQMRRAAVSVSSNIAEGSSRNTSKDQAHFYNISYGSLVELLSQIIVAMDLGYLDEDNYDMLRDKTDEVSSQLSSLRNSVQRKMEKDV